MARVLRVLIPVVVAGYVATSTVAGVQGDQNDAAVLADFERRVQSYDLLHHRLEGLCLPIRSSSDPAEIIARIEALGDAIREARCEARRGDIFTPEVAALFRRQIRAACHSDFAALLEMTHEDLPPMPAPQVNGQWPGEGITFMPPDLLYRLPSLPAGLQYRFVNRDLVLWDSRADLIVDILSDAIPPLTTP